jgi:hypothetical protein
MSSRRPRAWFVLLLCALTIAACYKKRQRRFGDSCGVSDECEGGVCHEGYCTSACNGDDACGSNICLDGLCQPAETDLDGDGLSNSWEKKLGLNASMADSDSDGLPDGTEVGDPSKPNDSNGDGVIDAKQSNSADDDKDCISDAWDKEPGQKSPLPGAKGFCNLGVCAGQEDKVVLTCDPSGSQLGPQGCMGCVCAAPGVSTWQAGETWCDNLDNDCDGLTDEAALLAGLPLGATCIDSYGACAAGGTTGQVECHPVLKTAICSTGQGGSASLAQPETCNGLDDDCDGKTDNSFEWQGKAVGSPCAPGCGAASGVCSNGQAPNASQVVCTPDGLSTTCSGTPFAKGFVRYDQETPQPRYVWSGLHVPAWQSMLLLGGLVPGVQGPVLRDELWVLSTAKVGLSVNEPTAWARSNAALQQVGESARHGAALAWDSVHNRVVIVGGAYLNGAPAISVLSLSQTLSLGVVSGLASKDPLYIAPVPNSSAVPKGRRALAAWMGPADKRALVAVWPGAGAPLSWQAGATSWTPMASGPGDQLGCLVPFGTSLLAVTAKGELWQMEVFNGVAKGKLIYAAGVPPKAMLNPQCTLVGSELHVVGQADADGALVHAFGTLDNFGFIWQNDTALTPSVTEALRRSGGVLGVEGKTLLLAGGSTTSALGVRTGHVDVVGWPLGDAATLPVSKPRPRARIGEAAGFTRGEDQFCIAGGLTFDLGDKVDGPARVVPVTDAWCASLDTGDWQLLPTSKLKPFALGISGVDRHAVGKPGRLVLAGGLPLQPGVPVDKLWRLWEGQLLGAAGKVDPAWQPTAEVQTIDLATGEVQQPVSQAAPALAASSYTLDPLRNRVLAFGGFDATMETHAFWSLDLQTLVWTDLAAQLPKNAQGESNHPNNRMGALMLYDPGRDLLALTAGSLRLPTDKTIGQDQYSAESGACLGPDESSKQVLWVARTLGQAEFRVKGIPSMVEPNTGKGPLVRRFPAGPAFLPVLYDPAIARGWLAVQAHPATGKDPACPKPAKLSFTNATVQVQFDVGLCADDEPLVASQAQLETPPSALLLAAGGFASGAGVGVIWSGIDRDDALSSQFHRLTRGCGP